MNKYFILLFLFPTVLFSQRLKNEHVFSLGVGISNWNFQMGQEDGRDNVTASSTPIFNFFYDYGVAERFSFGLAASYHSMEYSDDDHTFRREDGTVVIEPAVHTATRLNIAVRPLLHFGRNELLDWHCGFRIGYSIWEEEVQTSDPNYNKEYVKEGPYLIQTMIGTRAYISETVAIYVDVGFIEPYFASFGISVRP